MYPKPITERAKCKYKNMPVRQEVTIDAAGKIPGDFAVAAAKRNNISYNNK
tara:strand:+ start:368 stop:520 length:153 start_codon:yes stop_codon:yes gene_type:complete